jgi:hypothetical protein
MGFKTKTIPDKIYCQLIDKKKIKKNSHFELTYQPKIEGILLINQVNFKLFLSVK